MGVAGPPGPVMDRDEVDRALARLDAEHEAIETSLLALQDHAGRRLLEGAELTGTTQERWAPPSGHHPALGVLRRLRRRPAHGARGAGAAPLAQPGRPGGADRAAARQRVTVAGRRRARRRGPGDRPGQAQPNSFTLGRTRRRG